ncbi:hypothetical protein [Megalodesulfovibrio paquesii]
MLKTRQAAARRRQSLQQRTALYFPGPSENDSDFDAIRSFGSRCDQLDAASEKEDSRQMDLEDVLASI